MKQSQNYMNSLNKSFELYAVRSKYNAHFFKYKYKYACIALCNGPNYKCRRVPVHIIDMIDNGHLNNHQSAERITIAFIVSVTDDYTDCSSSAPIFTRSAVMQSPLR